MHSSLDQICPHGLVLACTYAFKMATFREWTEGRVVPFLINILGMRLLAKLVTSQGLQQISKERVDRIVDLIASQDRTLMVSAWRAAMTVDGRSRLAEIKSPTLVVAASNDMVVPFHHAKMLYAGIRDSQLVVIDGAPHALIRERPDEFARVVEEFASALDRFEVIDRRLQRLYESPSSTNRASTRR